MHLACCLTVSNEPKKAHFRARMSWATAVGGEGVSAGLGMWVLRADMGCLPLGWK